MLMLPLAAVLAVLIATDAVPAPTKDGSQVPGLPENWDQTKDDTQSLFLNKSDKNDLEPYPLAMTDEGNNEQYETSLEQRLMDVQQSADLDNLIMRPELYGEPPAMEGVGRYESRRKRGSGTKVGGAASASTKVATKNTSGKKNLKANEDEDIIAGVKSRQKRGSGKVGGAGAATKVATKSNSGSGKKNFRPMTEQSRQKRDSGLSAADVRALLTLWEAQERRKAELNNQWTPERYYRQSPMDDDEAEVDENGDIWYNEPVVIGSQERDFSPRHSYFSEQNRMALANGYPDIYPVEDLAQRYEEARRKRQYANKVKRFMVARKRSETPVVHQNYRPRDDLYTLAELLRSAPRIQEQDIPVYRRLIL